MNFKDADLAHRFGISRATVSNIFNTIIYALYELLYEGSQLHNLINLINNST